MVRYGENSFVIRILPFMVGGSCGMGGLAGGSYGRVDRSIRQTQESGGQKSHSNVFKHSRQVHRDGFVAQMAALHGYFH